MPSSIKIASNALVLIGDNPINAFDEPGAGAQAAANLYEETKKRLLSAHPWSFALKQQRLNQLAGTPDTLTGFQFAYQLPADLIRIWRAQLHSNYTLLGKQLLSNQSEVLLTYIFDVNETDLPPHFVKFLEYSLASDFAIAVTEDAKKAELYERKAINAGAQAMGIDAQGRPQSGIIDSPLIDARGSGIGVFR